MRLGTVAILTMLMFKFSGLLDWSWLMIIIAIMLINYMELQR